jgi:hypothetical protein
VHTQQFGCDSVMVYFPILARRSCAEDARSDLRFGKVPHYLTLPASRGSTDEPYDASRHSQTLKERAACAMSLTIRLLKTIECNGAPSCSTSLSTHHTCTCMSASVLGCANGQRSPNTITQAREQDNLNCFHKKMLVNSTAQVKKQRKTQEPC